jgi:hypothetical protein
VTAWCAALSLLSLRGSLTSGKVPGGLDVLAPGIAGALERGQLPLQQLGFVMSRAVVLQHGDDHRAVGVLEAGDHAERDQRAVLGAADRDLARAMR